MSITTEYKRRNITEVMHFTTSDGLLGIISSGALLAHSELPKENQLSHILQINCPDRSRDRDWHNYVNLSISKVNSSFFTISQRWHANKDLYWCILSFNVEILSHPNVIFSTTNNAYLATARASGIEGFNSLFQKNIRQFPNKIINRMADTPMHHTTCPQAEVLYKDRISLKYLQKIYVENEENSHEAEAQIEVCKMQDAPNFEIVVAPNLFR